MAKLSSETKTKPSKGSVSSSNQELPSMLKASTASSGQSMLFSTVLDIGEDDGSQAWLIVICCFLVNIVVMGFMKCLGILTIELKTAFKATKPSHVSILVSITACLHSVAGPLACYLVSRLSCRTVSFVGTCLISLGLMLSYFATSVEYLYFSVGILVGVGSGLTYSPGVILIGNYFQNKNRGIANGLVVSGSPVGGMLMPYTLNFLIKYLDCQGALLILGALMMNAVICTLSYKPYRASRRRKRFITSIDCGSCAPTKTDNNEIRLSAVSTSRSVPFVPCLEEGDSDDSSGPEFVDDVHPLDFLKTREPSTGSVHVYKINEKYGVRLPSSKKSQSTKITKMPPYWTGPLEKPDKLKPDHKWSNTAQNIQSKQSRTEIRPKKEEKIAHPFSARLRAAYGSGTGSSTGTGSAGLLTTIAKLRSPASSRAHPLRVASPTKLTQFAGVKSGSIVTLDKVQGSKGVLGSTSAEFTIRNRRATITSWKEATTPPTTSNRKLDRKIFSFDHSCVIMWSNESIPEIVKASKSKTGGRGAGDQALVDEVSTSTAASAPQKNNSCNSIKSGWFRLKLWIISHWSRSVVWIKNSPLKQPTYLILLFSNATTAIGTTNILILIPALAQHRGLSKEASSAVYLLVSFFDLCARLLGSFIYDRKYLAANKIFFWGLILSGVSSFGIGLSHDFFSLSCFGTLFGLSCGSHVGIFGALLAELVGVAKLPVGYAFVMILNGILQFTSINVSGQFLTDVDHAYQTLYFFYGFTLVAGGCLWFLVFGAERIREWRRKCCKRRPKLKSEDISPQESNIEAVTNNTDTAADNADKEK